MLILGKGEGGRVYGFMANLVYIYMKNKKRYLELRTSNFARLTSNFERRTLYLFIFAILILIIRLRVINSNLYILWGLQFYGRMMK